jgi:hypothetical protein
MLRRKRHGVPPLGGPDHSLDQLGELSAIHRPDEEVDGAELVGQPLELEGGILGGEHQGKLGKGSANQTQHAEIRAALPSELVEENVRGTLEKRFQQGLRRIARYDLIPRLRQRPPKGFRPPTTALENGDSELWVPSVQHVASNPKVRCWDR